MLQTPGHAQEACYVERHKRDVEARESEPEGRLAPSLIQLEAESFWKPVGYTGEHSKYDTANDNVVKMGDEEQAFVQLKISRRHCEKDTRYTANHEGDNESNRPEHRCRKLNAPPIHGEDPI